MRTGSRPCGRCGRPGMQMCCGGIIGMGETVKDRATLLQILAGFDPHPESVPINALVPVAGTPLGQRETIDAIDFVRMIAAARIVLPTARVAFPPAAPF